MNRFRTICFALLTLAMLSMRLVQAEVRFGSPVRAMQEEVQQEALQLSTAVPPREIAAGAEVVLISGYAPPNRGSSGTKVNVLVDRPQSKVLLVLTSYEKVAWQIDVTPDTKLTGIITAGYYPPYIFTKAKTQAYLARLPHAYDTNNINFGKLVGQLNDWFGVERVDAFRGSYTLPPVVKIAELDQPIPELTPKGPPPQQPPLDFVFDLLDTAHVRTRWSLTGPVEQTANSYTNEGGFAISKSGDTQYRLTQDGLSIQKRNSDTPATIAELPANFPRFSWAMDIAYDSKRNIVSVVSLGGEGFLYRFDAKRRKWLDFRSVNNIDIFALAYDELKDRYVAWTDAGQLLFISGAGEALFTKKLADRLPGFGRVYDRANGRPPRLTIVPKGNDIALIYISGTSIRNIWYYDVAGDKAMLTYLAESGSGTLLPPR